MDYQPSTGLRREMPSVEQVTYLNHAAVAPLPTVARRTVETWVRQATEEGVLAWSEWMKGVEATRHRAAQIIGATPAEIGLITNTTHGISLVAEGIEWSEGDNVVTLANEFPSNLYPWQHLQQRGVNLRTVPVESGAVDLARLDAACDHHTRLISVSWVGYATGWRLNLDQVSQIARSHGAWLFVDAIQGLGVFPLDVGSTPIDFLAADGHKWLLGPEGAGLLFVRRELLDELRPLQVGWNSVVRRFAFDSPTIELRPSAARFEAGTLNTCGLLALGACLQLLIEHGLGARRSALADPVLNFGQQVIEIVERHGGTLPYRCDDDVHRSGIVTFNLPGFDPQQVDHHLREAHVVASCRGGGVRISGHAYHDANDLQRIDDALASLLGGPKS